MRIENYEILKNNQWCYQVYRLLPEDWEGKRVVRKSPIDGRALCGMECFPNTLGAAVRRTVEFCLRDGIDATSTVGELLERLDELQAELAEL